MNLKHLMDACPNLEVVLVGDKPASAEGVLDVIAKASAYAQASGNSALSRKLNTACVNVGILISAAELCQKILMELGAPTRGQQQEMLLELKAALTGAKAVQP